MAKIECDCPECRKAREEGTNSEGFTADNAADTMAPLMKRHHELCIEILDTLSTIRGKNRPDLIGNDFAFVLLAALMDYTERQIKEGAGREEKFKVLDSFVAAGVEAVKHVDVEMDKEEAEIDAKTDEMVKIIAEKMGIRPDQVKIFKV